MSSYKLVTRWKTRTLDPRDVEKYLNGKAGAGWTLSYAPVPVWSGRKVLLVMNRRVRTRVP